MSLYNDYRVSLKEAYDLGYAQGYNDATEWIAVEDELPDSSGEVLALTTDGIMMILPYSSKFKLFNVHDIQSTYRLYPILCTHWQPLQQKPKGY